MSPKQVKVKFAFLTVGDVDTKSQRFVSEVLIQAKWTEPKLEGVSDASELDSIPDLWDPKLKIQNLEEIKGGRDEKWHTVKLGDKEPPVVIYRRRLKGSFYENMELKDFPRDVQDISVILRSELPMSEIEFLPDPDELSTVETTTFQDKQEWSMYRHVEVSTKIPETDEDEDESPFLNIPIITATARVARKSNFFFWNAILIMICIVTLSFCGFALDPITELKFRIGGNLTLLLTAVAFKLSVNQHLPMIPYLTGLDIYLISSIMFLCLMTILFAFLSLITDEEKAKEADYICLATLIPFQILFHVCFAIVFIKKTNKRRREMQLKDLEYLLQKKHPGSSNSLTFVREKDVKDRVRKETKLAVHGSNGPSVVNSNNNNNKQTAGVSEV